MIVQCPQCHKSYRLDDRYKDRSDVVIKCPGCQFRFHIGEPPESSETPVSEHPIQEDNTSPGAGGEKILVADDSPYFRTMVGDILVEDGYEVIYAGDGEEALTRLENDSPVLLILDLHLPKISGFEVIKKIRGSGLKANIPILVISSVYTGTSHVMALDSLGADEFIDKKFRPEYLLGKIKKLLHRDTGDHNVSNVDK